MSTTTEKIKIMQAYLLGEKIECLDKSWRDGWRSANVPCWNWNDFNYRIAKPVPELRKVKILAWFDTVKLHWYVDGSDEVSPWWKRVPAEDKEIEVCDD